MKSNGNASFQPEYLNTQTATGPELYAHAEHLKNQQTLQEKIHDRLHKIAIFSGIPLLSAISIPALCDLCSITPIDNINPLYPISTVAVFLSIFTITLLRRDNIADLIRATSRTHRLIKMMPDYQKYADALLEKQTLLKSAENTHTKAHLSESARKTHLKNRL